jgi:DNA-binding NarL/FixJ family response regulator
MRVVLADSSALASEGLALLLTEAGFEVVGTAADAEQLLHLVRVLSPDVAVADVRMPPSHSDEGMRAAVEIRGHHPQTGVLMLSRIVDLDHTARVIAPETARTLISGDAKALGWLLRDRIPGADAFAEAVRRVGAGDSMVDAEVADRLAVRMQHRDVLDELTERERDVLALLAQGRSNRAISDLLSLSAKTVEAHVRGILTKLDLAPAAEDHRRVLAVLTYLACREGAHR